MNPKSFRGLFCERFRVPPDDYERHALARLLYRRATCLLAMARNARMFNEDRKFIRYLGETTDLDEANGTVQDFQDINSAKRQFVRTRLKFRVSGRRALQLARELFRQ